MLLRSFLFDKLCINYYNDGVGDTMDKRYINQIEVIINLFTFDKGKLKVLLFRRSEEPFKGYWMLPSNLLMVSETIEECALYTIEEMVGLNDIYLKQCNVFSKIDRLPNERIIGNSLIGLVDSQTIYFKKNNSLYESAWFTYDELPKMVYDHNEILINAIEYLKNELKQVEVLKKLFNNCFTMTELQKVYEIIYGKELDRRNFRKKILSMNIIEPTGDKNINGNGRPAELYQFIEKKSLF